MVSDVLEFCNVIKFNWANEVLGETTKDYMNRVLKMLVISNSAITPYLYSFTSTRSSNNRPPSAPTLVSNVHRQQSTHVLRPVPSNRNGLR